MLGVLRGSVVKSLTRNPGFLGSIRTGTSGFFVGIFFWQDTSEPQPSTGETQKNMNNMSCRRDITENTVESGVKNNSINQPINR